MHAAAAMTGFIVVRLQALNVLLPLIVGSIRKPSGVAAQGLPRPPS
jgi:hypothetical protein